MESTRTGAARFDDEVPKRMGTGVQHALSLIGVNVSEFDRSKVHPIWQPVGNVHQLLSQCPVASQS